MTENENTSPENFLGKLPNLDLRKLLPISVVLTRFVLLKKIQIHLSSSKAFEYNLAKELHEKESMVLLCESKSGKPLIFEEDGTPYRGFLEGRVKDDSYLLILHLSNFELKQEVSSSHNQIDNEIPSKEAMNSIKKKLNRIDLNNLAKCDGEFLLMALEKTAYSAQRACPLEQHGWYPHTDEHDILLTVAKGLGNIGDRRAVPLLIELTNETIGFERSGDFWLIFIEALGNIGDISAKESLEELMHAGPVSWGCATKSDASHATYIVVEALKKLGMTEEELEEEFGYKY